MPDLNSKHLDFSQESNLKERLWAQIQQRMAERAPLREEIGLEELGPRAAAPRAAESAGNKPPQKEHTRQK
ncbi:MAG: hypothetical protein FWG93_00040 [Oscillospiraceae bacterium]|nr:hypothetical protein [Oscillospiraceae bacterium]